MSDIVTVEVLDPEVVAADLAKVDAETSLEPAEAKSLGEKYDTFYNEIVRLRGIAASLRNPETDGKLARETRLGLKRIRCEVEDKRKKLKQNSLLWGKAIDGYANVIKFMCEPAEEALESIEKYAERKEAARIAALIQERSGILTGLGADPLNYNLGTMNDDTWDLILKSAKEAKAEREEKARQEEADRIARVEADRIARQKAEEEAAEARKVAAAERKKREDAEAKARAEKAKADAELRKERDARAKVELEAADAKRKEQKRLDDEQAAKDKQDREAKELADKKAAAPDMEKVCEYISLVRSVPKPAMNTEKGKRVLEYLVREMEKQLGYVHANASKPE